MPSFLIRWVVTAVSVAAAASVIPGIEVRNGWTTYLVIALVLGLINATVGAAFKLITFPFAILTLGFSILLINALMLAITASLLGSFNIAGFWSAVGAALIIAVVSALLNFVIADRMT